MQSLSRHRNPTALSHFDQGVKSRRIPLAANAEIWYTLYEFCHVSDFSFLYEFSNSVNSRKIIVFFLHYACRQRG